MAKMYFHFLLPWYLHRYFIFDYLRPINVALSIVKEINFIDFFFFSDIFKWIIWPLVIMNVMIFVKINVFAVGIAQHRFRCFIIFVSAINADISYFSSMYRPVAQMMIISE